MKKEIKPAGPLRGTLKLPGDKSISHRALMIGSLAQGTSRIRNLLLSADCRATMRALAAMGIDIGVHDSEAVVHGKGLRGLVRPSAILDLGNSGTSMRLILGILAGQPFDAIVTGDDSLRTRPMKRVTEPLARMGARISGPDNAARAPLHIQGRVPLKPLTYQTPVASAQVKSALLLAGLYGAGPTSVTEPYRSRDHSEKMLIHCGVSLAIDGPAVTIMPPSELHPLDITIPGDISSAAFFMVAAALIPGSCVRLADIGCNPTRTGILDALRNMGADITFDPAAESWEPACTCTVRARPMHGISIPEREIPRVIDELPVLMVAAALAEGTTVIHGAGELRVKETDRVNSMTENLRAMGASIECRHNEIEIRGVSALHGAALRGFGDHRTIMASSIAALAAEGPSIIDDAGAIDISFGTFYDLVAGLVENA